MTDTDLRTGDIILAHSDREDGVEDKVIETFTHSEYVHAAIVIKDPWWTSPPLKGLYVLQANQGPVPYKDVVTQSQCGVTLNNYDEFMCGRHWVDCRKLYVSGKRVDINNSEMLKHLFVDAVKNSHGKPYDFNKRKWCWVGLDSFFRCNCCLKCCVPRQTDKFWCSALVSYIYVKCGLLPENDDFSNKTPEYLATVTIPVPYTLGVIQTIKRD